MTICCLCQSSEVSIFQGAAFFRCSDCHLIFKNSTLHLSAVDEKIRYELHENNIDDPAYVRFLWPAVEQVKKLFLRAALVVEKLNIINQQKIERGIAELERIPSLVLISLDHVGHIAFSVDVAHAR